MQVMYRYVVTVFSELRLLANLSVCMGSETNLKLLAAVEIGAKHGGVTKSITEDFSLDMATWTGHLLPLNDNHSVVGTFIS